MTQRLLSVSLYETLCIRFNFFKIASRILQSLHSWSAAQKHHISVDTKTTCVLLFLAETNGLLMKIIAVVYQTSLTCKAPCSVLDIVPNLSNNM